MHQTKIPAELNKVIGSEKIDFLTKSKWNYPRAKGISILILSFFFSLASLVFVNKSIVQLVLGEKIKIKGTLVGIESIGDKGMIFFFSLICLSVIISIIMLRLTFKTFFQKGAYFVGTKTRLIKFQNNEIKVNQWRDFTERISIKSKNKTYGNLTFVLKTGRMVDSGGSETGGGIRFFRPDFIHIVGIYNVYEIEKKCRIRIKENVTLLVTTTTGNNEYKTFGG